MSLNDSAGRGFGGGRVGHEHIIAEHLLAKQRFKMGFHQETPAI